MEYDFSEDVGKIWPALLYIGVFALVIAGLLLALDVLPRWGRSRERWHVLGFLGPAALLLCIGLIYPLLRTTYLSFFDAEGQSFVGIDNYTWIFGEDETLLMLRNTLIWVVCVPLLSTAFGLIYAV